MSSVIRKVTLRKYGDNRGELVENTLEAIVTGSKHFFVSRSRPGVTRANHYHKRKSEWFYVIQGTCKLIVKDLKTEKREEHLISYEDKVMINIGPNVAHAFKNIGNTEMILLALVNEVHNQDDPDTYSYSLV